MIRQAINSELTDSDVKITVKTNSVSNAIEFCISKNDNEICISESTFDKFHQWSKEIDHTLITKLVDLAFERYAPNSHIVTGKLIAVAASQLGKLNLNEIEYKISEASVLKYLEKESNDKYAKSRIKGVEDSSSPKGFRMLYFKSM